MKVFLKIASLLYFALLFYIFFLTWRRPYPSLEPGQRTLHIRPFDYKLKYIRYSSFFSSKELLIFYADLIGNILLFIPFAYIFSIVFKVKGSGKIILIAFMTSISVETMQFVLRIGVADIDDVILNTVGACIGIIIIKLLQQLNHPFFNKFLNPG